MDLGAEFAIPATASQVIDWESAEEDEGDDTPKNEYETSPILTRHNNIFSSPVLKSRRRLLQGDMQPNKRKIEMNESCSSKDVKRYCIDTSPQMPTLSSWLTNLSPSSPSPDSCKVSSCDSVAGLAPQPPADESVGLTGTSWLAGLEDSSDAAGVQGRASSSEEENDEDLIMTSDKKKKKPIRHGLVERLGSCLKSEKSKRTLAKYQVEQGILSGKIEKKILVKLTSLHRGVLLISGDQGTLMVNKEFCPTDVSVGDTVVFPTPRVSTLVEGKEVWLGVTDITVLPGRETDISEQIPNEERCPIEESLKCPCRSQPSVHCSNNVPMTSVTSPPPLPIAGLTMPCTSQSPTHTPEKVSTIRQVVERAGGLSASPQQVAFRNSKREQQMLELVVHRVFTRSRREDVNMTLDTTIGGDDMNVSLLCEDQAGDFSVVKLSTELKNEESWSILFGPNWEVVVGSKVTITSPLFVQNRITKTNKHKLFNVIRSIRNTNQRFCYVMKAFPGSKFELVDVGVVELPCLINLDRASRAQGCRINIKLVVMFLDKEKGQGYVQDIPPTEHSYWKLAIASSFPLPDQLCARLPICTLVTGLSVEYHGKMVLDNYSSMMAITSAKLDYSSLPVFSSTSNVDDLVKVEGVILRVDKDSSMQWVECSECNSEKVEKREGVWRCPHCGPVVAYHKIELVCCVRGTWVVLRDTAKKLLEGSYGQRSLHPDEVIGLVVPTVMCKVGDNMVAEEC